MSAAIHCEDVIIRPGLNGCLAAPQGSSPAPAVLVLMETFGLNDYIRDVCRKLAENGYTALAPDIFHGQTFSYDDLSNALGALRALSDDQVIDEMRASVGFLERHPSADADRLGVVGFCMGGRLAFLSAASLNDRIKGAVCFYGGGIGADVEKDTFGRTPPLPRAVDLTAPLLLLYGAEDASIPADEHGRIAQSLSALGKRYTLSVFPGAGHGFACHLRGSYHADASAAAWDETLVFFRKTL